LRIHKELVLCGHAFDVVGKKTYQRSRILVVSARYLP
jgi:hypothetical protein